MLELPVAGQHSPAMMIAMGFAGVLVLYVALKIGHILLKLFFGLVGLALIAVAGWFLFHH